MRNKPVISIILDRRRALASGKFPIRLQASFYDASTSRKKKWIQKLYSIWEQGESATEKEFAAIMGESSRVNEDLKVIRKNVRSFKAKAQKILDNHEFLNQEMFSRHLFGAEMTSVGTLFEKYIAQLKGSDQVGTKASYLSAMNSIKKFGGDPSFQDITISWLQQYTAWMKKPETVKRDDKEFIIPGRSITTIAMYLRCLRKIFNDAIALKYVSADIYPFGKRRYVIQEVRAPKVALTEEQKNAIMDLNEPSLRKGVDFWTFSYLCNGMNMADIVHLKNSDIVDGVLSFNRHKTIRTSPVLIKTEIPLRPEAIKIIKRWGKKSLDPDDYVFPVLEKTMNAQQQLYKRMDFIDEINEQLRLVKKKLKFNFKFTTGTARHTHATILLRKGYNKSEIQESLGHANIKTTENYTAGFGLEQKRKRGNDL